MKSKKYFIIFIASILGLNFILTRALAVDNPDAPDLTSLFKSKSARFESDISRDSGGGPKLYIDIKNYDAFLDRQLNICYSQLIGKIDSAKKLELIKSQKSWLAYRDNETQFIEGTWTTDKFGSSAILTTGQYREEIVKDRILLLLEYLRNYS